MKSSIHSSHSLVNYSLLELPLDNSTLDTLHSSIQVISLDKRFVLELVLYI